MRSDEMVAEGAVSEHRLILQALEDNDSDVAEAAMVSHLKKSFARVREALNDETVGPA
ncbi:FCD domain-containing protein [Amycolatopsis sp. WQ 127309]|uniref:FCD domain-containing protein n=1 Tax=Amycolatopsis sp. WQ 127309 TaxID=2932773 RepID=UPI001FF27E81|nr:FCD domain-containing protein [Amycolatopsis sp. WQ 127309]UOZ05597.1 FCD domain-containing protein [Amycolatopsis sp. WQ 127309]